MLRHEELMQREKELDLKRQEAKQSKQLQVIKEEPPKKNYFPDFSIIKDKLIKPLLFATEKVVEYYFPEEQKKEEKKEEQQNQGVEKEKSHSNYLGATSKTTTDSLSDSSNNELK